MPDKRAQDIIQLFKKEEARAANFKTMYQDVADLMFQREDQIMRISTPGQEKPPLFDNTGAMASMKMVSGLSQNLVPAGQPFFILQASDKDLNEVEVVQRYLADVTNITHEQLFASNFITQFNETLRSLVVFGTSCLFSEFTTFLNFRDYDVGQYLIMENSKRRVDTIMLKFTFTARQAFEEWGTNAGQLVMEALKTEDKATDNFEFIHIVRPRKKLNGTLRDNLNMPFESLEIAVKEEIIVEESGFEEFPYHVTRWTKSSHEVFGRGPGTFALPDVRMLQQSNRDFAENANRQNRPPLEVNQAFDGEVNMSPSAINWVTESGMIRAVERGALGNFPITKDFIEMKQELVRKIFFNDVFNPLQDLTGDRRNTTEIRERIQEGLQQIGPPIGRINEEFFNTLIPRSVFLLLRNGQLDPPPPELDGQLFKIEYISKFALELKSHQARAFQQTALILGELEPTFPGITDNLDADEGARELMANVGVSTKGIKPREAVEEIRRIRAEQEAAQLELQVAESLGKGYKDTSGAPEEGSPAQQAMEAIGA